MSFFSFGRKDPVERFWARFAKIEGRLFDEPTESLLNRLASDLAVMESALTFEIGPVEDGRRELVLSAGGISEVFPLVQSLVEAAPELERWSWTAFRPRRSPMELKIGGLTIDPGDVRLFCEPDGAKMGVTVAIPGYESTPEHLFEQAGFLFLDQALGEWDVAMRVGFVEFTSGEVAGVQPVTLDDLPDELSRLTQGWS